MAITRRKKACPYALSLSRTRQVGADAHGKDSVICRASHSAVGWRVTSNHSNCRRPCPRTTNSEKALKGQRGDRAHIDGSNCLSVVLKERLPGLRRRPPSPLHVFGDCRLGDIEAQHQQFAIDPGAPHNGFSLPIRRMRSRSSRSTFGRPALFRDFHRQNALKPDRCHRRMVSGCTTLAKPSRLGQSRTIHTSSTRSPPRNRRRGRAHLKAILR